MTSALRNTSLLLAERDDQPRGIGGWLSLVLLSILVSPFVGIGLFHVFFPWLKDPPPDGFNLALICEIILYLCEYVFFPVVLVISFFFKKKQFKRLYIVWSSVGIFLALCNVVIANLWFDSLPLNKVTSLLDIVLSGATRVLLLHAWIPYVLLSRRVASTFVN